MQNLQSRIQMLKVRCSISFGGYPKLSPPDPALVEQADLTSHWSAWGLAASSSFKLKSTMCPTFCVSSVDHFESANASPFSWFDQILRIGGSLAKFTSNDLFLANISICTVISVQRCITSSIVKKYHCHKTLCPGTSLPKDPPQCLPVCRQVTCASAAGLCKDTPWVFLHCQTEYFFIAKQSISQTPGLLICTIVHNKPLQWLARLCEDIPLASHCVVLYVFI